VALCEAQGVQPLKLRVRITSRAYSAPPPSLPLPARQNFARANSLPIDTLSWDFVYLNARPAETIAAKPADGCYIRGLFLEGARYDEGAGQLADSLPKQLYTSLPVLHLRPVQHRPPPTGRVYRCPVYKILSRWGVLATTGHSSNFVLFIEVPSGDRPGIINNTGDTDVGVWVRAGVAAFTSLKF
jgi:dynein heavy chain, axonemal